MALIASPSIWDLTDLSEYKYQLGIQASRCLTSRKQTRMNDEQDDFWQGEEIVQHLALAITTILCMRFY